MILTNSDMRCFATQVLEFFLTVKILSYLQILLKHVLNKPEGGGGGGTGGRQITSLGQTFKKVQLHC